MENQEVIRQWSEAARYWKKHRALIEEMFAPVSRALVLAASVRPGQTVLDVATGPGEPALSIAALLGSQGRVFGVDIVPAMVEAATREAERRRVDNASFRIASAEALPFEDQIFDAAVCRFGVMFFPSPPRGLSEMSRVLKPGGRLALAAWHHARNNPFHSVVADVLDRYVEPVPMEEDAPDAFRFAPAGKLLQVARRSGLQDVEERLLRFSIDAPISVEGFWDVRTEMSDKLRTKLAELPQAQVLEIKRAVLESARGYSSPRGLSFPAEVWIVSGTRPAAQERDARTLSSR